MLLYSFVMDVKIIKLEKLKDAIEKLDKTNHLEVLKLLKKHTQVVLNENKSGTYINLTYLSDDIVDELDNYMKYITDQELTINEIENQKTDVKNEFFTTVSTTH